MGREHTDRFRPLVFFSLERVSVTELGMSLDERLEGLGMRENFVHQALAVYKNAEPNAVCLSARDYRTLLGRTKLQDEIIEERQITVATAKRQLRSLLKLLEEDSGYRVFLAGNGKISRTAFMHIDPFLRLATGGWMRLHRGVVPVPVNTREERWQLSRLISDFGAGWEADLLLTRIVGGDCYVLSSERYLALYRERKIRGLGCPDCGSATCVEWNEPVKAIRAGVGNVDLDDLEQNFDDMLREVSENDEWFVLTEDGKPVAMMLSEREFMRLCLDDGSNVSAEKPCSDPFKMEIEF